MGVAVLWHQPFQAVCRIVVLGRPVRSRERGTSRQRLDHRHRQAQTRLGETHQPAQTPAQAHRAAEVAQQEFRRPGLVTTNMSDRRHTPGTSVLLIAVGALLAWTAWTAWHRTVLLDGPLPDAAHSTSATLP